MNQHKYENVLKFVQLNGIKEFKETDPSLFSDDGISTSTLEIDNGKSIPVTVEDARHACELFLNGKISLFQLQQWGEWIITMDFFELIPDPDEDEFLINIISELDSLDNIEDEEPKHIVEKLLQRINAKSK